MLLEGTAAEERLAALPETGWTALPADEDERDAEPLRLTEPDLVAVLPLERVAEELLMVPPFARLALWVLWLEAAEERVAELLRLALLRWVELLELLRLATPEELLVEELLLAVLLGAELLLLALELRVALEEPVLRLEEETLRLEDPLLLALELLRVELLLLLREDDERVEDEPPLRV